MILLAIYNFFKLLQRCRKQGFNQAGFTFVNLRGTILLLPLYRKHKYSVIIPLDIEHLFVYDISTNDR